MEGQRRAKEEPDLYYLHLDNGLNEKQDIANFSPVLRSNKYPNRETRETI